MLWQPRHRKTHFHKMCPTHSEVCRTALIQSALENLYPGASNDESNVEMLISKPSSAVDLVLFLDKFLCTDPLLWISKFKIIFSTFQRIFSWNCSNCEKKCCFCEALRVYFMLDARVSVEFRSFWSMMQMKLFIFRQTEKKQITSAFGNEYAPDRKKAGEISMGDNGFCTLFDVQNTANLVFFALSPVMGLSFFFPRWRQSTM